MKVMTILGTRPEIIRLSRIIPLLDTYCDHILVHTGQNYDFRLNEIFFGELKLRTPNYLLDCKASFPMAEIGKILTEVERVIRLEAPDRILLLGDTNSALAVIAAKRYGIPVFHMEAGNRCFDDRVPEEVNRRIIDHSSAILLPYTERSRANLIREGIAGDRIYVTGNPILEVLSYYAPQIDTDPILSTLHVDPQQYVVLTLHRAENVDPAERLDQFITAFHRIHAEFQMPVICSLHPRTRSRLEQYQQTLTGEGIVVLEPLGLFSFIQLEKNAFCVLTDSGTVQEECCIYHIPNLTLRDVTERPETVEAGSNIIAGADPAVILRAMHIATSGPQTWLAPPEYVAADVSHKVLKIIMSHYR